MSSLPVTQDLTAYRGDTWAQTFRLVRDGAPVDLTAAAVEAWAKKGSRVVELLCTAGTEPGEVTIGWPETEEFTAGKFAYDVEVTGADGVITTWVKGTLVIEQDVTNADV